jgi:hypothetical protein
MIMPYTNLYYLISNLTDLPDFPETLKDNGLDCRRKMLPANGGFTRSFDQLRSDYIYLCPQLSELIFWATQNHPEQGGSILQQILADIPEADQIYLHDELYTCELNALDSNTLTPEKFSKITDRYGVGSGNIYTDILIRNWMIGMPRFPIPEFMFDDVMNTLPEIWSKMNSLRPVHPYYLKNEQYLCDLNPKTPFYISDSKSFLSHAKEKLQRLFEFSEEFNVEIFTRAVLEAQPNFWQNIIAANYSPEDQAKYSRIAQAEHLFLQQLEEHSRVLAASSKTELDKHLEHIKFALNLARTFYLECRITKHFEYAATLATTEMSQGLVLYINDKQINDPEIKALILAKLELPNTEAANQEFATFVEQINSTPTAPQHKPRP